MKTAICPKCQASIVIEQYQPEMVNTERLSFVSISHERGIDCSCGEYLIPAIQAVNLDVALVSHIRPQNEARILPVGTLPFKLARHGN